MRISYGIIGNENDWKTFETQNELVRIGSADDNEIILRNNRVADRQAIIYRNDSNWELRNDGQANIAVGPNDLQSTETAILKPSEAIRIYPFGLSFEAGERTLELKGDKLDEQVSELIRETHRSLLEKMVSSLDPDKITNDELQRIEKDIEEIARLSGFFKPAAAELLIHSAGMAVLSEVLSRVLIQTSAARGSLWHDTSHWANMATKSAEHERELAEIARSILDRIDSGGSADLSRRMGLIETNFATEWKSELESRRIQHSSPIIEYLGKRHLKKEIKDILFGYGPIEDLVRMPNISEIMVVSIDKIYVEKSGVLERSGRRFVSDAVTEAIITRIVQNVNRRIDKSQPLVDARLRDGSRVNAIIDPIALSGPCLTIRKFPAKKLTVKDLIGFGALTPTVSEFLEAAVCSGKNILVSGGTGTGKTTLLNCLSDFIPDKERIVTIEDTAELQLKKDHVVTLETKAANVEGKGEYSIRDLVRNSLRMRPDRIVVGECRGPEALDMLQAMNTGHDGSMTTIHANTSEDVVQRLEILVLMAAELPVDSIHRQIASAIDLVVQLKRLRDGSRKVSQVTEFVDYDANQEKIHTKDLFLLSGESKAAELNPTGALPTFMDELIDQGLIKLDHFYR